MSYDDDSRASKIILKWGLNLIVSFEIYIRSSLIKNKDLSVTQNSSGKANELLLTNWEEIIWLCNDSVNSFFHFAYMFIEIDLLKHLLNFIISVLLERINVLPDRALDQERRLRYIGYILAK